MSFEDDRQRQVRTGQSINLAVSLAQNEMMGEDAEKVLERAHQLVPSLSAFINAVQDGAVNTVEEVKAAFPGGTVEQNVLPGPGNPVFVRREPAGPVAAAQGGFITPPPPPPAPAPSPVPGASNGTDPRTEALWKEYFADPTAWWDNRSSKKSAGSADFAHKARKNQKGYPVGLWLYSKFGNAPDWVFQQLQGGASF